MNAQPVSYLQTDPKWKSIPYAVKGESSTIGGSGCGPTSMAMVLATWADPSVTPKSECVWALKNGYKAKGQGTFYAYFTPAAKRYGLDCKQLNYANIYGNNGAVYHTTARNSVLAGDLVIACMGKGNWTSSGHFVLVWWIDQAKDIVYINDPASTKTTRTRGSYKLFCKQVKYYFVIKRPAKLPEREEDMTEAQTKKLISDAISAERSDMLVALKKLVEEAKPKVYNTESEIPEWYKPGYELFKPVLYGKETGLGLTEDLLRTFTLLQRAKEQGIL